MRARALVCSLLVATAAIGCKKTAVCDCEDPGPDGGGVPKYPSGPYGTEEGDILMNFGFEGLVNEKPSTKAKDADWVASYSVGHLQNTDARYALIHVSAIGNAGSEAAASKLVEEGGGLQGAGAQILEVLSTAEGSPASERELREWVTTHEMSVTAVVDSPESPLTVLDALGGAPESAFIIKVPEMKIEWVAHGMAPEYTTVQDGIHWLHSLLAE